MTINALGQSVVKRSDRLFASTERKNVETAWSMISEFMLPNQSGIFFEEPISGSVRPLGLSSPGTKKTSRLFDSTAIQANHDLASTIQSLLTSPSVKWSKIKFSDEDLNNDEEATHWLEDANDRMHAAFNESNFDNQMSKNYKMFTSLGSMALFHEEQDLDANNQFSGFKFTALHLSQIAWSENKDGIVDTLYWKVNITARQARERFGNSILPTDIAKAADEDPDKSFSFLLGIFPRDPKDVDLDEFGFAPAEKRPFASVYVAMDGQGTVVENGGYYEFPIHVTRWETLPGEVYGRSPGHIALPDVRSLNRVKELSLQAIAKAVNPPLLTSQRNMIGPLSLSPGTMNVVRDPASIREFVTQARFDVTQFGVSDLRESIKQIFFLDKLLLPPRTETGEMTAFEVSQRVEQMQKVLGPTLGRLNTESLSPLITRSFKMMLRGNGFATLPNILIERGVNIKIEFVNQLARSQKAEDISNIQSWAEALAFLNQVSPGATDWIDGDGIALHTAKIRGVPEVAIRDKDKVAALRDQRAKDQKDQQQLEGGAAIADIVSKLGGTGGQQQDK